MTSPVVDQYRVITLEDITQMQTNTGDAASNAAGFPRRAIIEHSFSSTVGWFFIEDDATAWLAAFAAWMAEGGPQPLPEDFNGVSVF